MKKSKEEIYKHVINILAEEFELDAENIKMDANLYEELGLDSIDAVDLVVKLQEYIGSKIDPNTFKKVRTVEDIVLAVDAMINK